MTFWASFLTESKEIFCQVLGNLRLSDEEQTKAEKRLGFGKIKQRSGKKIQKRKFFVFPGEEKNWQIFSGEKKIAEKWLFLLLSFPRFD